MMLRVNGFAVLATEKTLALVGQAERARCFQRVRTAQVTLSNYASTAPDPDNASQAAAYFNTPNQQMSVSPGMVLSGDFTVQVTFEGGRAHRRTSPSPNRPCSHPGVIPTTTPALPTTHQSVLMVPENLMVHIQSRPPSGDGRTGGGKHTQPVRPHWVGQCVLYVKYRAGCTVASRIPGPRATPTPGTAQRRSYAEGALMPGHHPANEQCDCLLPQWACNWSGFQHQRHESARWRRLHRLRTGHSPANPEGLPLAGKGV